VPGHWEGDLLFGSHHSQIATPVERHTRYVVRVKVLSKDTDTVVDALIRQARKRPRELYKSLTWDRGKEMAAQQRVSLAANIQRCFCGPQHPWQRGSTENNNGLPRQYSPKEMDLPQVHQNLLNVVARRPNERPRETLDFETPGHDSAKALRRAVETTAKSGYVAGVSPLRAGPCCGTYLPELSPAKKHDENYLLKRSLPNEAGKTHGGCSPLSGKFS
jgi:IS30 family transposase